MFIHKYDRDSESLLIIFMSDIIDTVCEYVVAYLLLGVNHGLCCLPYCISFVLNHRNSNFSPHADK